VEKTFMTSSGREGHLHLAAKIQELLDQNPFESARSMAETLQVSHSTVLKQLHEDIHFQSFHLRWVPHLLTPESREQRRGYGSEMISDSDGGGSGWLASSCHEGRVLVLFVLFSTPNVDAHPR
jgi:hypothetical protein